MIEDYIIDKPYQPTSDEVKAIDKIKKNGITKKDWNSKRKGIESLKRNIREYMFYKQGCMCAYCKMEMLLGCSNLQKDHIVPKSSHLQWMFLPQNLCVTCDKCNNYKGDIETLVDSNVTVYPSEGKSFKIIHPFFDKYSDHIEIVDDLIYRARTDKGKFTINTCKLFRLELISDRARLKLKTENSDSLMIKIISLIDNEKDKKEIIKIVKDIINNYKQVICRNI